MKWDVVSDIGMVRDQNEDYVLVEEIGEHVFALICDGMGGCLAGEVASEEAGEMMRLCFLELLEDGKSPPDALSGALQRANARVWHLSASEDEYMGMGTTLTAVWTDGKECWFASVGDSRGYVFAGNTLTQVTEDQSFVWDLYKQGAVSKDQLRTHPMNHLVSMAVGLKPELSLQDIGLFSHDLAEGDVILLCSDGLTDVMPEAEIEGMLRAPGDISTKARSLVDRTNAISGKDNISVLLIQV